MLLEPELWHDAKLERYAWLWWRVAKALKVTLYPFHRHQRYVWDTYVALHDNNDPFHGGCAMERELGLRLRISGYGYKLNGAPGRLLNLGRVKGVTFAPIIVQISFSRSERNYWQECASTPLRATSRGAVMVT